MSARLFEWRPAAAAAACLLPALAALPAAGDAGGPLARFRHGVDLTVAPSDTRGELDDWKLIEPGAAGGFWKFLGHISSFLVLGLIGLGGYARSTGAVPRGRADELRRVCFTCLLPAFLFRHIWLCQLDTQLYAVAAWSFAFHGLWFFLSVRAAQAMEPKDRQMRGWTMLMSQGAMNSFLYPLLLNRTEFGEKALACAVLWDLGGNMWICQFGLFAIAAYFKPASVDFELQVNEDLELDGEEGEALISRKKGSELAERQQRQATNAAVPREIIIDALKQPVLGACVFGFLLNLFNMPLPVVADTPLWVVGEPYKPALYFLVGYYGDHKVGSQDISRMCRALGTRYAICVIIIALVLTLLPLEAVYRHTVALALLSPTSSYLIYLVGEHGYGERLLRLTVCGGFVSTLVSTLLQNILIELVVP